MQPHEIVMREARLDSAGDRGQSDQARIDQQPGQREDAQCRARREQQRRIVVHRPPSAARRKLIAFLHGAGA